MVFDVQLTPVAEAYARTNVNSIIFRQSALVSWEDWQFCSFYAPDATITLGKRLLGSSEWEWEHIPHRGNVADSHNVICIGVSHDGLLHLSYDHHNHPLRYRMGTEPGSIRLGPERLMTGAREESVTYPQFVNSPDGRFYYLYRDGRSGNGDLCVNVYDPEHKDWQILQHSLIAGIGQMNAYWWRPSVGFDGSLHLAWCWRRTGDPVTNRDICYAVSRDGGRTWTRSDGSSYSLPITHETAEVIDPVPEGSNLINQCSGTVDSAGRPHFVHFKNDKNGIPQIFHLYYDGSCWRNNAVTNLEKPFEVKWGVPPEQLLRERPICRPDIVVTPRGTACVIYRNAWEDGRVLVSWAMGPDYASWRTSALTDFPVGRWEPSYDPIAWRERNELHLWVQACGEGWPERGANGQPQMAYVAKVGLLESVL